MSLWRWVLVGSPTTLGILMVALILGVIFARRLSLSAVEVLVRGIVLLGALGLVLFAASFVLRFWPVVLTCAGVAAVILLAQGLASWFRHSSGRG